MLFFAIPSNFLVKESLKFYYYNTKIMSARKYTYLSHSLFTIIAVIITVLNGRLSAIIALSVVDSNLNRYFSSTTDYSGFVCHSVSINK